MTVEEAAPVTSRFVLKEVGQQKNLLENPYISGYFLKLAYIKQAYWKLLSAWFLNPNLIGVLIEMNMDEYVDSAYMHLEKQSDGFFQWSGGLCDERKCVDSRNAKQYLQQLLFEDTKLILNILLSRFIFFLIRTLLFDTIQL